MADQFWFNLHQNMKDINAAAAIGMRLRYDWIVLLYGLFCVLVEILCKGDLGYFLLVVGIFVLVEVFAVSVYRKLQDGGEGYHSLTSQTLDQESSVGSVVFCMVFDFAILLTISLSFLVHLFKHCVK
jgi:hypothetical protein